MTIVKGKKNGFSVIEVILAAGLFVMFASGIMTLTVDGLGMGRLAIEQLQASEFNSEGKEAVRSIKNESYAALTAGSNYGVASSTNGWVLKAGSDNFDKYYRAISISTVQRDANGNIVASGGTVDANTMRADITTTWNYSPTRSNSVSFNNYFTNWELKFIGNYSSPLQDAIVNLTGSTGGYDIAASGNFAYVTVVAASSNFAVINITNSSSPSISSSINLPGKPAGINHAMTGNYAYVANSATANELEVVNVTTPTAAILSGSYNAAGNNAGTDVFVQGTRAYLTRAGSTPSPNFIVLNITSPTSPALMGSLTLAGSAVALYVSGSYAFVASSTAPQGLQVVNITSPSSPTLAGSLSLTGTAPSTAIDVYGNTAFVGRRDGSIAVINITAPSSPTLISTYSTGTVAVTGIDTDPTGTYLFASTATTTAGIKIIDISTLTALVPYGSYTTTSANNNIFYHAAKDRLLVANSNSAQEVIILKPQ